MKTYRISEQRRHMVETPPKLTRRSKWQVPEEVLRGVQEALARFDPDAEFSEFSAEDAVTLRMAAYRFGVRYPRSVMDYLEHQARLDAMPMHETRRGST